MVHDPGRRARSKQGGRAPSSSLGEETTQQRDGQLKSRRLIYTERRLTARLTTVVGRSQSEQTPPDGIANLSPARTGLDQAVADERPTWLRTLRSDDLVRRVAVVDRLKLCLLVLVVMASGLVLLALAAFVVLTNKVALVITLAILGTIVLLLGRSALAEARKMSAGR